MSKHSFVSRALGIYPEFRKFLAALDGLGVHISSSLACGISRVFLCNRVALTSLNNSVKFGKVCVDFLCFDFGALVVQEIPRPFSQHWTSIQSAGIILLFIFATLQRQ